MSADSDRSQSQSTGAALSSSSSVRSFPSLTSSHPSLNHHSPLPLVHSSVMSQNINTGSTAPMPIPSDSYIPLHPSSDAKSSEASSSWASPMDHDNLFDYSMSPPSSGLDYDSAIDYDKKAGDNPWETPGRGATTFLPGPLLHPRSDSTINGTVTIDDRADPVEPLAAPLLPAASQSSSSSASAPFAVGRNSPISRFPGGVHRPTLSKLPTYRPPPPSNQHKLSQWFATAISGNDITSSCLYVTGLVMSQAGLFTPISLFCVAVTLYLFRDIYGEAVTALPLNGGAYNLLLNTTSKSTAAMAACLTVLSYIATCVVSGSDAISYLRYVWPSLPQELGTVLLICLFAFLNLMGMTESAVVAFGIFAFHIFNLSLFVIVSVVFIITHQSDARDTFSYNWECQFGNNGCNFHQSIPLALWFGFSQAMLGVSGFESSANFVEEQADGVFVKTLRNMWALVAFFNPAIALLTVFVMRVDDVAENHTADLLAAMAQKVGASWHFDYLISVNAFLVLSGSVLTAFVGVNGLCRRLALDRCMPQILLAQNSWRKTNHFIILGFCGLCISLYLILNGNIESLANVYSVSFLSVMALFAIGNMLLKYKRGFLPRQVQASWSRVGLALALVAIALAGVLAAETSVLLVWAIYFCCTGLLIMVMFFRMQSLKLLYHAIKHVCKTLGIKDPQFLKVISSTIKGISSQAVVFFVKHGALPVMNKAVLYVRQNEDCAYIRVVHVYEHEDLIPPKLQRNVNILDEEYPKVKIDLVLVKGTFGPEVIDYCSQTLKVPKNLMFITCPKADFTHKLESLGGVRLITH